MEQDKHDNAASEPMETRAPEGASETPMDEPREERGPVEANETTFVEAEELETRHDRRRDHWLETAAALEQKAAASDGHAANGPRSEARRLRLSAGSALAHAEADAREAGYTSEIDTVLHNGSFYIRAKHPMGGDWKAWPAGRPGRRQPKRPEIK